MPIHHLSGDESIRCLEENKNRLDSLLNKHTKKYTTSYIQLLKELQKRKEKKEVYEINRFKNVVCNSIYFTFFQISHFCTISWYYCTNFCIAKSSYKIVPIHI